MPKEIPPFGGYPDTDVERIFDWMISFLSAEEWRRRVESIETQLEVTHAPHTSRETATIPESVSILDDRSAWYLYLIDTVLHAPLKYEPTQGARVVPIFKRLGTDFDLLMRLKGVNDRVARMLSSEKQQPDGALFELLVALVWMRNGCNEVELLDEAPPEKRPDIRATIGKEAWYIECKRLDKTSAYSERERSKWLQMWTQARDVLIDRRYSVVLDVVFHVELESLPDDFLVKELCGKLAFVRPPCSVISNEIWDVSVSPVDYAAAQDHLSRYCVKYPSDQVVELIGGRREPNRGFTSAIEGNFVRKGDGTGNNCFLEELSFAIGAFWNCDAIRSTERKARDIRGHLAEAVRQLPDGERGVVHVGLETLDGQIVEAERYARIVNTVRQFDARGKDLRWVYCHLFQSYAPPHACWIMDETVYYFGRSDQTDQEPISRWSSVIPEDEPDEENDGVSVHWLRPTP
ncbi:MAG: hypothetical protein P8171_18495 [Candidatus Thiodiazotropha sp.]